MSYKISNKAVCLNCSDITKVFLGEHLKKTEYNGKELYYTAITGFCKRCHHEVSPEGIWDENLLRIQEAYHECYTK